MIGTLVETDEEFLSVYKRSWLGIGGEEFLAKLDGLYEAATRKRKQPEDVALRGRGRWLPAEQIVEISCRHLGVKPGAE